MLGSTCATSADAQILGLSVTDALLDLDARVTLDGGRITVLDGRVTTVTNTVAALDTATQTLSAAVTANTAATSALTARVTAQAGQATALDVRLTLHDDVLTALQAADVAVTSQLSVQVGSVAALDGRLGVQETASAALGARVGTAESALTAVQTGLSAQVGGLAAVGVRVTAAEATTTANTGAVVAIGTRTGALETAVGGIGTRVGVLEGATAANASAVATLDARVGTVAADVTVLGGRVGVAETAIATTAQAVAGLDVRVNDNSAAITRERTRNDQQDQQLASQSTRIDAVGAVANTALADTQTLRSDVVAGRIGIVQVAANTDITVGATLGGNTVSMAGTGGTRRISGVSAGSQADDAVTVGQLTGAMASTLGAANLYTDRSILRALDQQMGATRGLIAENNTILRREMNGVAAGGAALSGLPQSMIPGKGFAGVSMGGKGSEVAIALGASKAFNGEHAPVLRAGAAIDTRRGDLTYNAGVGFHF